MAYPTPSIYSYRVVRVVNPNQNSGYWLTEYSANGGSTWNPLHTNVFQRDTDAFNAIGFVVSDEPDLRDIINGVYKSGTLTGVKTILSYPPA